MTDAVIAVRGAVREYPGGIRAVDGVDLTVGRGRILALLGPSGCGKTTFLRLVAGFERPDAGAIAVEGRTVADARTWVPPERRRVGVVFQDYALFPHLSVRRNVAFGLPGRRLGPKQQRIGEVLELVGLAGKEDRHPHELSGGEQQRVAIARALAPAPAVILLDEPFSNLDASLRGQVRQDVRSILREAGATAIFVTHDQEEALSLSDEVAVMHDGRLHQRDIPERLYHSPVDRTVAAFVGDAEFLPGRVRGAMVDTDIGSLPLLLGGHVGQEGGAVDVMVRPEDILLEPDPRGDVAVLDREFYGHDQVLHVRLAGGRVLRVRQGPFAALSPGDRCRIVLQRPVRAFPTRVASGPR